MWHDHDEEQEIGISGFLKKSKFNPKETDAAIEIC